MKIGHIGGRIINYIYSNIEKLKYKLLYLGTMAKKKTDVFMETKPWYKSKTVWINVLLLIGAVATGLQGELVASGTLTLSAVANIVLRAVSRMEITL